MSETIVSTAWLAEELGRPDLVVVDLRWGLFQSGTEAHAQSRVPGAVRLEMDTDLADRSDLTRGRHPLPDPARFAAALARVGIGPGRRVVVYDDAAGGVAARLWWMLRWVGGPTGAVLDGGFRKWVAEGRPVELAPPRPVVPVPLWQPAPHPEMVRHRAEVAAALSRGAVVLDARAAERYRGEAEPIDPRAGHIPGARNVPVADNLTAEALPVFRSKEELRRLYSEVGAVGDREVICSCGSGVSACVAILALELAGRSGALLYPGSWSEWCQAPLVNG
jgi:thiosulfate/3-mercaptopyruvate sulfurtransferase